MARLPDTVVFYNTALFLHFSPMSKSENLKKNTSGLLYYDLAQVIFTQMGLTSTQSLNVKDHTIQMKLKGMATHSSMLAWEIPWTEEPGGLQSMGSQRVGQD